jgi:hypothetical protein
VSASACTRSFIRASWSSASLDICPILRSYLRGHWNFTREFSSVSSVVFRTDQSGMSAIVVVLHPAQRPAGRPDLAGLVDWGAGSARHRLARGLGDDEAVMEWRAIVVLRPDGQRERSVTKPEVGA